MHQIEERPSAWLATHCRWLALACILSTAIPIYVLRDIRINNAAEVWLGARNRQRQQYNEFLARYGNEEFVALAGAAEDPLSDTCLAFQRDLADRLRQIEHVDDVFNLATPADILAEFRQDWPDLIRDNTLFRNLLLGEDGRTFGMLVYLKTMEGSGARKTTIEQIERAIAATAPDGLTIHLAGTPVMNVALDRGSLRTSQRFLPAAITLSVIILALTLRGFTPVLAVLCAVAVTTLWAIGILVASGRTLNMITISMPSLLFVLSLSGGIHITSRFLAHVGAGSDRSEAARLALAEVMRPVFLSNITTALGFGALCVSEMGPVVEFGIFTGIGILLSFLFNMTIVSGILCLLYRGSGISALAAPHWTADIGSFLCRHRKPGLAIALIVFVISVILTLQARVESNVLEFFPKDSQVKKDYDFIGNRLTGMYSVEIDVTTAADQGPAMIKTIDALSDRIAQRPEVAKTMHYKSIAACFRNVPVPLFLPSLAAQKNPMKPMLGRYLHRAEDTISLRLSVFVRRMANSEFNVLLDYLEEEVGSTIATPDSYVITGITPLAKAAEDSLIDTQMRSFALAGSLILVVIGLFMRSLRAALAAVLPNLLPIFCVFAVMTLLDIPFDTATVMISSVAIGIAADDTVHFLAHYREDKRRGGPTFEAVRSSLQKAGPAITYTSIVTSVGFAILLLAEFIPIRYFGLFTGITMITAWIGDVLVLPACVAVLRLWDTPRP